MWTKVKVPCDVVHVQLDWLGILAGGVQPPGAADAAAAVPGALEALVPGAAGALSVEPGVAFGAVAPGDVLPSVGLGSVFGVLVSGSAVFDVKMVFTSAARPGKSAFRSVPNFAHPSGLFL